MKLAPGTRRSRSRGLAVVAAVLMAAAWATLAPPRGLAQGRGGRQAAPRIRWDNRCSIRPAT